MKIRHVLATLLSGVMLLSAMPVHAVDSVPVEAIGVVIVDGRQSFYYNYAGSGPSAMWNDAVSAQSSTVRLYADWVAENGSLGAGYGFSTTGVICVPEGHEVTIDLNGFSIDRGLTASINNGEVIYIANGAKLNLTDTNTASRNSGTVTGGNSLDTAGGIEIGNGGTLNVWGGNISGNKTAANGGGVRIGGASSTLSVSGGNITGNHADVDGGGVAMPNGTFSFVSGSISGNSAESGGGVYAQAGTFTMTGGSVTQNTAVCGGGMLLNGSALLSMKGNTVVQSNQAIGENAVGGGIMLMTDSPLNLSGSIQINSNIMNGVASNLVFLQDDGADTVHTQIINNGILPGSRIGVSLFGNGRDVTLATSWFVPEYFSADQSDYELLTEDNQMVFHSLVKDSPLGKLLLLILCVALCLMVVCAVVLLLRIRKKAEKQRRRKKRRKPQHYIVDDD